MAKRILIKRPQSSLTREAPFDTKILASLGISAQLASRYVRSGWLLRLARCGYASPGDPLDSYDIVRFLQARACGLHIGGGSALAVQETLHNLAQRGQLVLWGEGRYRVSDWFTANRPVRYAATRRSVWADELLDAGTKATPPGRTDGLGIPVPERAVLEWSPTSGRRRPSSTHVTSSTPCAASGRASSDLCSAAARA